MKQLFRGLQGFRFGDAALAVDGFVSDAADVINLDENISRQIVPKIVGKDFRT